MHLACTSSPGTWLALSGRRHQPAAGPRARAGGKGASAAALLLAPSSFITMHLLAALGLLALCLAVDETVILLTLSLHRY